MAKTVVVTGASTGIGRATAQAFHEAHFDVVATMRDPSAAEGLECRVEALDVTSNDSVDRLFDAVGRVDILVSNAGIAVPGACEETDVDYLHQAMDTNFYGAVRCTRKVLAQMRERREGCILYTTSIAGRITTIYESAYSATKYALEAWGETLAYEMAPFGVRVAMIEPGFIHTPIFVKPYRQPTPTYEQTAGRYLEFLLAQGRHGTQPDAVGKVMVEAATTATPRLRWIVGPDAQMWWERLAQVSEDDLMSMYAQSDDDSFWAAFEKLFGPELAPQRG